MGDDFNTLESLTEEQIEQLWRSYEDFHSSFFEFEKKEREERESRSFGRRIKNAFYRIINYFG